MEISNKTLTWLVVAAIVVSLGATVSVLTQLNGIKSITGMAPGDTSNVTGTTNITIGSQTTLRFNPSTLDFGTLSVNVTKQYCNISINATNGSLINKNTSFVFQGCDNQTGQPVGAIPLTLENAGSTYLNISLNFTVNAATLITGSSGTYGVPTLAYTVNDNETGSCTLVLAGASAWINVTTANTPLTVCQNLSYGDSTDSLIIGLRLGIPMDATSGTKGLLIRAQGTALN